MHLAPYITSSSPFRLQGNHICLVQISPYPDFEASKSMLCEPKDNLRVRPPKSRSSGFDRERSPGALRGLRGQGRSMSLIKLQRVFVLGCLKGTKETYTKYKQTLLLGAVNTHPMPQRPFMKPSNTPESFHVDEAP